MKLGYAGNRMVHMEIITDRVDELEAEREEYVDNADPVGSEAIEAAELMWEKFTDEGQEWRILTDLVEEVGDADYLVAEDHWAAYVREMLEDCGDIPRNMPWYIEIDWGATADNIKGDYGTVEFDGGTWHYRYS